ncbi:MAG: XRE family transcriptional regulator [Propionibacteriales bacterium]|nr:XRE family transcriptional regulator [Propionibacteriales bacterium]
MAFSARNGKEGGSQASLLRQWKDWEAGRVKPRFWAPYIAETFGTVTQDLFPTERSGDSQLIDAAGMDTAELIARLRRSTIDDATLRAVRVTADRLCTEYRYRASGELRTEGHSWLRRVTRLLGERLTLEQHREALSLAGLIALLVGCVEYDAGDPTAADATRGFALDLAVEVDDHTIMGWAYEMEAWMALTSGDYHRVVAASERGRDVAGHRGVGVQLAAQAAKAWARLGNRRQVEIALDRGRSLLESLPNPPNPDHHFVIDPAKWHFYCMDAYRLVDENALAQTYADEVLRLGVTTDAEERSPMRNAEARATLGVIAARAGDLDAALDYGHQALSGSRKSLPTLAMVSGELARTIKARNDRHPDIRQYLDQVRETRQAIGG